MFVKTNVLILTTLIIFISASMQVFGFPWNYDMWKQKSIKPYEMPMSYPKGTVTTDGKTNPIERETNGKKKQQDSTTQDSVLKGSICILAITKPVSSGIFAYHITRNWAKAR